MERPEGALEPPLVVVLIGVSGSGKTTVGQSLATRSGWAFLDADDLHSPSSIDHMGKGDGLTDKMRGPWIERLRACISSALKAEIRTVLACSALKDSYRQALVPAGEPVAFAWLQAAPEVLQRRLTDRAGHFVDEALLESQLQTLEPPAHWPSFISEGGEHATAARVATYFSINACPND
ncbi:hypothetical protein BH23BAC4_BH23BAC4_05140 [soil metagenome]